MKRTLGGAALLTAFMALTPWQAPAQTGARLAPGVGVASRGAGVEMLIRQKERLELTEAQLQTLEQLRQEAVQRRTRQQAERLELTSRVRAGLVEAAAYREQLRATREAAAEAQKQQRERVEAVLTEAQKEKLQELGRQARAYQMGRMGAMRGRVMGPGAAWGGPGRNWGARQGLWGGGRGWQGRAAPMMRPGRGRGAGSGGPWHDSIPD